MTQENGGSHGKSQRFKIGMLVLSVTLPPLPAGVAIALAMTLIALLIVRIPFWTYAQVLAIPIGFALVGAVAMIFSVAIGGGLRIGIASNGVFPPIRWASQVKSSSTPRSER